MARIVVTGGTGFIGSHLVRALVGRGDSVTVLSRDPASVLRRLGEGVIGRGWNPDQAGDWFGELSGQDAVVHLAGERAVGVRWTDAAKRRIHGSRVDSTRLLVEAMAAASERPRAFVCASGINIYGAHPGDEEIDEQGAVGSDFLARVAFDWEAAARDAEALGVRVVSTRFGVVFARDGGAIEQMALPFKLFAGGPLGSGKQVVSWVHVDDVIGILLRCLDDEGIQGAVNVVAPSPVTNAELSRAIGKVLGRPSWLKVPAAALKARFGEGAGPLVTGQRVVPRVMQERGYSWQYPELGRALQQALGS